MSPDRAIRNWIINPTRAAAVIAASLLVLFCFALAGYGIAKYNMNQDNQAYDACKEIELLKTGFRDEAKRDRKNLPTTAHALGIKVTPELLELAEREKNNTLRRYKANLC